LMLKQPHDTPARRAVNADGPGIGPLYNVIARPEKGRLVPGRSLVRMALVSLTTLAFCGAAAAQTTNATIVGDVTDPAGGRIAGAKIAVKNVATGVIREVQT